jgi:hypothetical protein
MHRADGSAPGARDGPSSGRRNANANMSPARAISSASRTRRPGPPHTCDAKVDPSGAPGDRAGEEDDEDDAGERDERERLRDHKEGVERRAPDVLGIFVVIAPTAARDHAVHVVIPRVPTRRIWRTEPTSAPTRHCRRWLVHAQEEPRKDIRK